MKFILGLVFLSFSFSELHAQDFVRQTSHPGNPNLSDYWTGASWVDYDQDGDQDLFMTNRTPGQQTRRNILYKNLGNGSFSQVLNMGLVNANGYWFGNTWGDYDNDGDLDVYVSGFPSRLFKNTGQGGFIIQDFGTIGSPSIGGTGSAFVDLNNDGNLDIFNVWPNWLPGPPTVGGPQSPYIMINQGPPAYTFSRLVDSVINAPISDTYMHPVFMDFDDDGDQDVCIGMGAGFSKRDLCYRNLLKESGQLKFEQINDQAFSLDLVEGNQWTFIDLDNDLDLDAYVCNWGNSSSGTLVPESNSMYRNAGGVFQKDSMDPLTQFPSQTSTSLWGDFDNDADQDCILVSDSTYPLQYYQNDGQGGFSELVLPNFSGLDLHQSGGSVTDHDEDGDLDLFIPGPGTMAAFFDNDLNNGNNWVEFQLEGGPSNKSGIGAKIFVYARVNGNSLGQRRDVGSSTVFFGSNSLIQHVGLLDASVIDSLVVLWPSGNRDEYFQVPAGKKYVVTEGQGITGLFAKKNAESHFMLSPNPSTGKLNLGLIKDYREDLDIEVLNSNGKVIQSHAWSRLKEGTQISLDLHDLPRGLYFIQIQGSELSMIRKVILE